MLTINSLENLNRTLCDYQDSEIKKPEELKQNIITCLEDLEKHLEQNNLSVPKPIQEKALKILTQLNKVVEENFQNNQPDEIISHILNINAKIMEVKKSSGKTKLKRTKTIDHAGLSTKSLINKPKIDVTLGIIFDLDSKDKNGAMSRSLLEALGKKSPIITTCSIVQCSEMDKINFALRKAIKNELLKNYDILSRPDSETGKYMLVLLPKILSPELTLQDKLASIDLVSDGTLKEISFEQVDRDSDEIKNVDELKNLFNPNPTANKFLFVIGHGNKNIVGGFKENNYLKFLNLVEEQKAKGLMIISCFSGGQASLMNIPDVDKPHNFATIVQSIGDFPTSGINVLENLDIIKNYLENPNVPATLQKLKRSIESKGEPKNKSLARMLKIYFPHSVSVPAGFRQVGEYGRIQSLTYTSLKAAEASKQKKISISKAEGLALHPTVIQVPIKFKSGNPVLFSMIPGNGMHMIESIQLDKNNLESPAEYLARCIETMNQMKQNTTKIIFIKSLSHISAAGSINEIKDVVLRLDPKEGVCFWRKGTKHFFQEKSKEKYVVSEMSAFSYAMGAYANLNTFKSSKKAMRSLSGGQEINSIFEDQLKSHSIYKSLAFNKLFEEKEGKIICRDNCLKEMLSLNLKSADEEEFLFFLMILKRSDLVKEYLKTKTISLNCHSMVNNNSLLNYAISVSHDFDLAELLLAQPGQTIDPSRKTNDDLLIETLKISNNTKFAKVLMDKGARFPEKVAFSIPIARYIANRNYLEIMKLYMLEMSNDNRKEIKNILMNKLVHGGLEEMNMLEKFIQFRVISPQELLFYLCSISLKQAKWEKYVSICLKNGADPLNPDPQRSYRDVMSFAVDSEYVERVEFLLKYMQSKHAKVDS